MTYGYMRGFVIESDDTRRKRVNCKDCIYYCKEDKSCIKRPLYMPEDGYMHWKTCDFFDLDETTSNYYEKYGIVSKTKRKSTIKETSNSKEHSVPKATDNSGDMYRSKRKTVLNYQDLDKRNQRAFKRYYQGDETVLEYLSCGLPGQFFERYMQEDVPDKNKRTSLLIRDYLDSLGCHMKTKSCNRCSYIIKGTLKRRYGENYKTKISKGDFYAGFFEVLSAWFYKK